MKIRSGFVSNSSSSSFLLVGVEVSETGKSNEELEDLGLEFGGYEGEVVGVHHYVPEYDYESFSIEQIIKDAEKVRKALGIEPRVYVGMEGG